MKPKGLLTSASFYSMQFKALAIVLIAEAGIEYVGIRWGVMRDEFDSVRV